MDTELEQINNIMGYEISSIKEKYNKQKREIRKKYRELEKKANPKPKRISIPKSVKDQLWDNIYGSSAGEGGCYVCSNTINSKQFDCGHITAVSNGGTNDITNLKPICSSCNKSMGTKNMDEFKKEYYESNKKTQVDDILQFLGRTMSNGDRHQPIGISRWAGDRHQQKPIRGREVGVTRSLSRRRNGNNRYNGNNTGIW